jgi:hypothetical protein
VDWAEGRFAEGADEGDDQDEGRKTPAYVRVVAVRVRSVDKKASRAVRVVRMWQERRKLARRTAHAQTATTLSAEAAYRPHALQPLLRASQALS